MRNMDKLECGTRVTISNAWKDYPIVKMTWESGAPDTPINEVLEGIFGCLVGLTWSPNVILNAMKDFVEEKLPNDSEEN